MTDRLTGAFIGQLFNCVCFGADEGVEVYLCVCGFTLGFAFMNTLSIGVTTRSQNNKIKAHYDNGRCVCMCVFVGSVSVICEEKFLAIFSEIP